MSSTQQRILSAVIESANYLDQQGDLASSAARRMLDALVAQSSLKKVKASEYERDFGRAWLLAKELRSLAIDAAQTDQPLIQSSSADAYKNGWPIGWTPLHKWLRSITVPRRQNVDFSHDSFYRIFARYRELMRWVASATDKVEFATIRRSQHECRVVLESVDPSDDTSHIRTPARNQSNALYEVVGKPSPHWETAVSIQCVSPYLKQQERRRSSQLVASLECFWTEVLTIIGQYHVDHVDVKGSSITCIVRGGRCDLERNYDLIRCALAISDHIEQLKDHPTSRADIEIAVTIGIATANLPMHCPGARSLWFFTEAASLARRLASIVAENCIIVCQETRDIIESEFNCAYEPISAAPLVHEPLLRGFEVISKKTGKGHAPPFVGRTVEMEVLLSSFQRAVHGNPSIVCLRGPTGIGKTRLLRHVIEKIIEGPRPKIMPIACRSLYQSTPLHPVFCGLRQLLGLEDVPVCEVPSSEPIVAQERTRFFDESLILALDNAHDSLDTADDLDRSAKIGQLSSQIRAGLLELARWKTIVIVADKTEFADAATIEFVRRLVLDTKQQDKAYMLLLLSGNNSAEPLSLGQLFEDAVRFEQLATLSADEAEQLLREIVERKAKHLRKDKHAWSRLRATNSGIPGEIANSVSRATRYTYARPNSQRMTSVDLAGRPTLNLLRPHLYHGGIAVRWILRAMAMLEHPATASCLMALLAEFRNRVTDVPNEPELGKGLRFLLDAKVLAEYSFRGKQHLFFTTSLYYQAALTLVPEKPEPELRKTLVDVMENESCGFVSDHPEVRAINLEWGGELCQEIAAEAWRTAGDKMSGSDSSVRQHQAAHFYGNSLRLASASSANKVRLGLLIKQIRLLAAAGYNSDHRRKLIDTAKSLAKSAADSKTEFILTREEWSTAHNLSQFEKGIELAASLERLAKHDRDKTIEANHCGGLSLLGLGDLSNALSSFALAAKIWEEIFRTKEVRHQWSDHDPGPCCTIHASLVSLLMGKTTESEDWLQSAFKLSNRVRHHRTRAIVANYGALIRILEHKYQEAESCLDRFPKKSAGLRWDAMKEILMGARIALDPENGEHDRRSGINRMILARRQWEARGEQVLSSVWACLIASAQMKINAAERARNTLDSVDDIIFKERFFASAYYRLSAEATFMIDNADPTRAIPRLKRSLVIAKEQGNALLQQEAEATAHHLSIVDLVNT